MSARDLYGESGDRFDAFLERLVSFIHVVVLFTIALALSLIVGTMLFTHEVDSYASHVHIVKYNL